MQKRITPMLVTTCSLVLSGAAMLMGAMPAHAAQVPLAVAPERVQQAAPQELRARVGTGAPEKVLGTGFYLEAVPVPGSGQVSAQPAQPAAKVAPGAESTARAASATQSASVGRVARPPITTNAVTPLCTVLNINTSYSLSGTATGGSYCYGFQITQRAKTQVFISGQNASTNFALTLIKHNDDDTLTVLGTSDNAGNANEGLLALTQPGLYYWLMDANASDGSSFNFGAIVNTNADANELNDTLGLATTFPAVRTTLSGNMDSATDVDYFQFVSQNGQSVVLRLNDSFGLNEWIFQYYTGSAWSTLSANQHYTLTVAAAPSTVYVRVLPNPSATLNPAHSYGLLVGSQVASSDNIDAFTTESIVRVQNPFLVDQAHQFLNWTIRLRDSAGNPVQGAVANFNWRWEGSTTINTSTAVSNSAGVASGVANLGSCSGTYIVQETTAGQTWRTWFDIGAWDLKVTGASSLDVGVGGPNFPDVSLGHICSQQFIP